MFNVPTVGQAVERVYSSFRNKSYKVAVIKTEKFEGDHEFVLGGENVSYAKERISEDGTLKLQNTQVLYSDVQIGKAVNFTQEKSWWFYAYNRTSTVEEMVVDFERIERPILKNTLPVVGEGLHLVCVGSKTVKHDVLVFDELRRAMSGEISYLRKDESDRYYKHDVVETAAKGKMPSVYGAVVKSLSVGDEFFECSIKEQLKFQSHETGVRSMARGLKLKRISEGSTFEKLYRGTVMNMKTYKDVCHIMEPGSNLVAHANWHLEGYFGIKSWYIAAGLATDETPRVGFVQLCKAAHWTAVATGERAIIAFSYTMGDMGTDGSPIRMYAETDGSYTVNGVSMSYDELMFVFAAIEMAKTYRHVSVCGDTETVMTFPTDAEIALAVIAAEEVA